MSRGPLNLVRALLSLLVLVALLVGIPAGLLFFYGNPLPTRLPALSEIGTLLSSDDTLGFFVFLVVWVGWIAWATFALSFVLELVARLRGVRAPRIPGLGVQQGMAALLLTAILGGLALTTAGSLGTAASTAGSAPSGPSDHAAVATAATASSMHGGTDRAPGAAGAEGAGVASEAGSGGGGAPAVGAAALAGTGSSAFAQGTAQHGAVEHGAAAQGATEHREAAQATITVRTGDSLWSLAQHHLGDGHRWNEIAEANYDRAQPDGQSLLRGDMPYLEPGWVLVLPGVTADAGAVDASATIDHGRSAASDEGAMAAAAAASHAEDAAQAALDTQEQARAAAEAHSAHDAEAHRAQVQAHAVEQGEQTGGVRAEEDAAEAAATAAAHESIAEHGPGGRQGAAAQAAHERAEQARADHESSDPGTSDHGGTGGTDAAGGTDQGTDSSDPGSSDPASSDEGPSDQGPTDRGPSDDGGSPEADTEGSSSDGSGAEGGGGADDASMLASLALPWVGISPLLAAAVIGMLPPRTARRPTGGQAGSDGHDADGPIPFADDLARAADPEASRFLDLALRALAGLQARDGAAMPDVHVALLSASHLELVCATPMMLSAPFEMAGDPTRWRLPRTSPVIHDATLVGMPAPYPALVPLGTAQGGGTLLVDLERLSALGIAAPADLAPGTIDALAASLAALPWTAGLTISAIALDLAASAEASGNERLHHHRSVADYLEDSAARAADAVALTAEVLLVGTDVTDVERARLHQLIASGTRQVSLVEVAPPGAAATGSTPSPWRMEITSPRAARLEPLGVEIEPQHLTSEEATCVLRVVDPSRAAQPRPRRPDPEAMVAGGGGATEAPGPSAPSAPSDPSAPLAQADNPWVTDP